MPGIERQQSTFQFGVFELNARTRELRKYGVKLKLQDQPLQVLVLLLERPGEIVTREEIQKRLWPENTYVDFDNAINSAIRKLRGALGDDPANPRFVETLARRGYRFIAPLSRPAGVHEALQENSLNVERLADNHHRWPLILIIVVLVLAGIGVRMFLSHLGDNGAEGPSPPVPLTSYPGYQQSPSFSPDGSRVVFSWDEPGKRPSNIYVKLIGPGDPVPLTTDHSGNFAPAWSPDGRLIAFLRKRDRAHALVMVMAALGGQERELAPIMFNTGPYIEHGSLRWTVLPPLVAWSADSRWLLAVEQDAPEVGTHHVIRISTETGEKRPLTFPPHSIFNGDGSLAVAPDGRRLAFIRTIAGFVSDIFTVPLSQDLEFTKDPERLTFDKQEIAGLSWAANGQSLIFSSSSGGKLELWRMVAKPSGKRVRLTAAGMIRSISPFLAKAVVWYIATCWTM